MPPYRDGTVATTDRYNHANKLRKTAERLRA